MRKRTMPPASRTSRPRARQVVAVSAGGALALAAGVAIAVPAAAQAPQCAERAAVLERLADSYHEEPVSIGVTATGSLLEVLASPEGTWTIIITVPNGPTCLVSSGEGWRGAPVQIAQDPRV